jgi:predicted Zn finger-like uncharacterized protein
MFTVCPKCMLTLAVTANDLRMGQGYVRCGRCANVFNALLALSEEPAQEAGASQDPTPADRATSSQIARALSETPEEPPGTPTQAPASAQAASGPPMHLPTEQSSDGAIENESNFADGTGTFETIVLEGEAITQTEEYVPEESVDHEIAALTHRLALSSHGRSETEDSENVASEQAAPDELAAADELAEDAASDSTQDAADDLTEDVADATASDADPGGFGLTSRRAPTTRPRWTWIAGSIALLLLLALQAINHWRDALASSPPWSGAISRAYGAIGVPLDPHWDLGAYEVRQQGAVADPADNQLIRVRVSLANHAARSQPMPLLRLTLLDRYGKRIAASDLTPAQYWPAGAPPRASLGHDERIDSEIAVRDPSAASASFELDVCLRGRGQSLHCAADLPPNPAPAGAAHP